MTVAYDPTQPGPGETPQFPPLLRGVEVKGGVDPFAKAVADARSGRAETGDLYWSPDEGIVRGAIVFGPEETLEQALPILFAVACGLNDCIGALAPPEVGLEHVWPDGVKVNGAWAGALHMEVATRDRETVPDWLVVGIALSRLWPADVNPGEAPDLTALSEEGCGHLTPVRLLESWARHTLVWVHQWEDGGFRAISEAWLARAEGRGGPVRVERGGIVREGTFLGIDERGAMLLKGEDGTDAVPLAAMLDEPRPWPPDLSPPAASPPTASP